MKWLLLLLVSVAHAQSAVVAWNPVTAYTDGSPIAAFVYYQLWGSISGGQWQFRTYVTLPAIHVMQPHECVAIKAVVWNPSMRSSALSNTGCVP